jgi:predicted metal-dependent hydrolase
VRYLTGDAGELSVKFINSVKFIKRNEMSGPNGEFLAGEANHEHPHHEVLQMLQAENVKLRKQATEIALEIEKLREARNRLRPR